MSSQALAARRLRRGLDSGYIRSRGRDGNLDKYFWQRVTAIDAEDGTITARWMEPPGPYHGLRDMVEHSAQRYAIELFAEDLITAGLLPATTPT